MTEKAIPLPIVKPQQTNQFILVPVQVQNVHGVFDPNYGGYEPIDANLLRLLILGVGSDGEIVDKDVTVTVKANETSGKQPVNSAHGYLVIRKVTIPAGVTLNVYADGSKVFSKKNTGSSAITIDLASEYGFPIYGASFDLEIVVDSAPSEDKDYTVTIKGVDVPKIQSPQTT